MKEMIDNNLRVRGEFYLINFLLPLEHEDSRIIDMINTNPDMYISFFIKCCGQVMSNIPSENRIKILERLMKALEMNGFDISIKSHNLLLETWLENDYYFDVDKALENTEIEQQLTLNVDFFNNLLWSSAYQGKDAKIK